MLSKFRFSCYCFAFRFGVLYIKVPWSANNSRAHGPGIKDIMYKKMAKNTRDVAGTLQHQPIVPPFSSPEFFSGRTATLFFLLLLLALYGGGLGVRMMAAPAWDSPEMRIQDRSGAEVPLLATPDAYYWLAGASGKGGAAGQAPSLLLKKIEDSTGMRPEYAAWLLPALLASVLGPLLAIFCRLMGFPLAGIFAGLLATLAPAYYCRTGLGYYDTDMLLLSVALSVAIVLLFLMREQGRAGFVRAVLLGATIAWLQSWHRLLPVCTGLMLLVSYALVLARTKGNKSDVLYRLALFACSVFFSWPGFALAGFLALVLLSAPGSVRSKLQEKKTVLAVCGLVLAAVALFSTLRIEGQAYLERTQSKTVSGQQATTVQALVYPPMTRTIAESGRISFAHLLTLLHPWAGVALAGLCGFIWLARRRPEALLLGPLLLLGLCAPFLGARTAMFAVPAAATGFGVGAEALLGCIPLFTSQKTLFWAVRGLLAVLICLPLLERLPPSEPALSAPHAEALQDLGRQVSADTGSVLWTWWDFGYAASYYSGLHSFADPGRQGPEYVYFLSKVLGTDSLSGAARLMRFSADYDFHPWEELNRRGAEQAQKLVTGMLSGGSVPSGGVGQYLELSLEGLRLLPVITDFARWNLRTGKPEGSRGVFQVLELPVTIDLESGKIDAPCSGTRLEVGALLLWKNGSQERIYDKTNPLCLVAISDPEEYLLLDRRLFDSNYLQLLLGNPQQYRKWFRLVVDKAPYVRIYELVAEKNRIKEKRLFRIPGDPE